MISATRRLYSGPPGIMLDNPLSPGIPDALGAKIERTRRMNRATNSMTSSRHAAGVCVTIAFLALWATTGCFAEDVGTIEFVESWPQETALDLADLRDAPDVWIEALAAATARVDVASFYFSRKGDGKDAYGPDEAPDLLVPVLTELVRAAERGVDVRLLADGKFIKNYPAVPEWIDGIDGAETRIFDMGTVCGSGVLHAKYFLIDDEGFYVGSQNWDWRALNQIHELGVLVRHPGLTASVRSVFELDWDLAGANQPVEGGEPTEAEALAEIARHELQTASGHRVKAVVAASPATHLPAGVPWDLPLLIEMIDAARDSVHLQLLSYGTTDREKRLFDDLDRALRRAAVRGAKVHIILANWSKSKYKLPWIKSLAAVPGIEIRFTNIPEFSGGFIPFARVEHAKYLTVDGNALWIGTSNWSRDYFYNSRNLSLFLLGAGAPRDPDVFFNLSWQGPYAEIVEPGGEYSPPRRN